MRPHSLDCERFQREAQEAAADNLVKAKMQAAQATLQAKADAGTATAAELTLLECMKE
jgi:hypothetical protein